MHPALSTGGRIISQREKKCTIVLQCNRDGGVRGGMLYQAYQASTDIMLPVRALAGFALSAHGSVSNLSGPAIRNLTAAYELISRARLTHTRPDYGIKSVMVGNREVEVTEEKAHVTPFGTLLRFKKDIEAAQPKVMIVAPLSGHFATLLRGTVRTMLPEHDVYITDWHNARDVPTSVGPLRLRRLRHPSDRFHDRHGSRRAYRCGLPTLCRGFGGRRRHGAGRPSGAAAIP